VQTQAVERVRSGAPVVTASGLSCQFAAQEPGQPPLCILDRVSLQLVAGERLAIVGASGSGKSTLLMMLAGLEPLQSGSVRIGGQELAGLDEEARVRLRRELGIGLVFQDFRLIEHLSALENVALPLALSGVRDARPRAMAALEAVGLQARRQHRPAQLSGGERQRVALARAFAQQPRLLFADEPTGSLDAGTGARVLQWLWRLGDEHGTAMVLVTHDLALAQRCDRCLRLTQGQLLPVSATDSAS